ncbi:MAG: extracellular solute-binding protein [Litorilinea sp.]
MSKQISRRGFLQLTGAVASVGVLAACAPGAAPAPGAGTTDAAPSAEGASLIWDTFRAPGTGWNELMIETFQEANPDVAIEFRPLVGSSQQDNYGKMYAQHAAGDLGDIIAFDPSHFHFERAINGDIVMPLDDLAEAADLDETQWFPQFMEIQYYQGNLYGLPSWGWAGHDSLVTNAHHLQEEGIEVPDPTAHNTPMAEIGDWARRLYRDGERFGLSASYAEPGLVVLLRIWESDLINADGTQSLILDDERAHQALRWLYDLAVTDNVLPAPGSIDNVDVATTEGRISMAWGGALNVRNVNRQVTESGEGEISQILFPERSDGVFPCQIRGGTWNILNGSQHPTEAFAFLQHITSEEGCFQFNDIGNNGALVRPDVLNRLVEQEAIHAWFIPNLENGIAAYGPANSRGREYTDAITQYMALFMDPTQPIEFEQGLADLHNAIQTVLDMPAA